MRPTLSRSVFLALALLVLAWPGERPRAEEPPAAPERTVVPAALLVVDDGDSFEIRWPAGTEVVRILGIDTPETFHPEHDLPWAQPFGDVATGFLRGALAVTDRVELLRSGQQDPYGRTLGYLYLDGRNYSVLVLAARLAVENVRHFGDNGLPGPAAEVLAAADAQGPVPFEPPHRYRARLREVSRWMRANGRYPCAPRGEAEEGGR